MLCPQGVREHGEGAQLCPVAPQHPLPRQALPEGQTLPAGWIQGIRRCPEWGRRGAALGLVLPVTGASCGWR